jgi:ubiquinone/menaquinone biosynthesis C-methylase UbiE
MEIHQAAAVGFDRASDAYERGRPGYPRQAVESLTQALDLDPASVVVDLAAGTGKLTRELLHTGARVIAVEPVAGMRAVLSRSCPQAEVVDGIAEELPLPDASADAVTVAQAFHWFDGERALAEIDRVLRPAGRLALIWNERDLRQPIQAELERLFDRHRGSTPSYRDTHWRDAFAATGLFEPAGEHRFDHFQRLDAEGLVNRVGSVSFVAALPEVERERLLHEVRTLARGQGGEVELAYETDVFVYSKSPL